VYVVEMGLFRVWKSEVGKVRLEDDVFLGAGQIILPPRILSNGSLTHFLLSYVASRLRLLNSFKHEPIRHDCMCQSLKVHSVSPESPNRPCSSTAAGIRYSLPKIKLSATTHTGGRGLLLVMTLLFVESSSR
jgi:hypothetical protein